MIRLHFLSHLTVLNYFTVKFNHDFTIYNERFPKKPSRLQAVSYTHLDVYKRQFRGSISDQVVDEL